MSVSYEFLEICLYSFHKLKKQNYFEFRKESLSYSIEKMSHEPDHSSEVAVSTGDEMTNP